MGVVLVVGGGAVASGFEVGGGDGAVGVGGGVGDVDFVGLVGCCQSRIGCVGCRGGLGEGRRRRRCGAGWSGLVRRGGMRGEWRRFGVGICSGLGDGFVVGALCRWRRGRRRWNICVLDRSIMLLDEVLDMIGYAGGKGTWISRMSGCADDMTESDVDLEKEADEAVKGSEEQQKNSP